MTLTVYKHESMKTRSATVIPDSKDLAEGPASGRLNLATQIDAGVNLRLRLAALARSAC